MTPYYRAQLLGDLRRFAGWAESVRPAGADLADDTVVYLREDLTVVLDPLQADQGVLWDALTPQWHTFCADTLRFEVPSDLRPARI